MAAAIHDQGVPSIASATTNAISSDHSTPAMSFHEHLDDDLEKGTRQSDQQNTMELITSESPDANPKPSEKINEPSGPPAPSDPGPPPDGGYEAWMTVLGAFCGLFVSFGWINCKYYSVEGD